MSAKKLLLIYFHPHPSPRNNNFANSLALCVTLSAAKGIYRHNSQASHRRKLIEVYTISHPNIPQHAPNLVGAQHVTLETKRKLCFTLELEQ